MESKSTNLSINDSSIGLPLIFNIGFGQLFVAGLGRRPSPAIITTGFGQYGGMEKLLRFNMSINFLFSSTTGICSRDFSLNHAAS